MEFGYKRTNRRFVSIVRFEIKAKRRSLNPVHGYDGITLPFDQNSSRFKREVDELGAGELAYVFGNCSVLLLGGGHLPMEAPHRVLLAAAANFIRQRESTRKR